MGDRWDEDRGMVANGPVEWMVGPASIDFDPEGRAWVPLLIQYEDNTMDVACVRWADGAWSPMGVQVNMPDSTDLDFYPTIRCGGGQVWCVWYGGTYQTSTETVYASRWDSIAGVWGPEMRVSPPDGNSHWFANVAVDAHGTPHVVWIAAQLQAVYYSYYDGNQWVGPIAVNDTAVVKVANWGKPRIVIDRTGIMHVSFTGVRVGAMHRDIFYTRNDGSGWSPCQMVTRDSLYDEWYSDIAADGPDNVWIVWDRQGEGPDQFRVYASHFDGHLWAPEERLDDDSSSYNDLFPWVCLDPAGYPWVTWHATAYDATNSDIFYNHYDAAGVEESVSQASAARTLSLAVPSPCVQPVTIRYALPVTGNVSLEFYDRIGRKLGTLDEERQAAGPHTAQWPIGNGDGGSIAPGIYFCRLKAAGVEETCSFVLLERR
ncbi:MAG: hypothetical protein NTX53_03550 [candidate division WOR-3 bacterium]|nr:hypothetical protein [candidate division WOR-3 bacterium]